jgi:hypothetical protein
MNPTPEHLIAVFDKWPDILEVYRDNDNDKPVLKFVVFRKNSRSFTSDLRAALELMREAGLNVVVRVGQHDLTLEEFDRGGAYGVTNTRLLAQSTFYNKQAELKRLERGLDSLPVDDVNRYEIGKRVQQLKTMLGLSDQLGNSNEALRKSDERLRELEKLAAQQNGPLEYYSMMSDDQLADVPNPKIVALDNTPLLQRFLMCKAVKRLLQYKAELLLQPDSLELRAQILAEEQLIERYKAQREEYNARHTTQEPASRG